MKNGINGLVRIPRHVAIIMDGNGRWAKGRGLERIEGHAEGARAVRDAVETASRNGIQFLTLYAFSVANWARPRCRDCSFMGLPFEAQAHVSHARRGRPMLSA